MYLEQCVQTYNNNYVQTKQQFTISQEQLINMNLFCQLVLSTHVNILGEMGQHKKHR